MATATGPVIFGSGLSGGTNAVLNITATGVIKATPGILVRLLCVAPGTAGSITLNDCATVGAAATTNQIVTIAFGSLTVGQSILLEWPCATGIVVSAATTGGNFSISYC